MGDCETWCRSRPCGRTENHGQAARAFLRSPVSCPVSVLSSLSLLLVVPGHGDPTHTSRLIASIQRLQRSARSVGMGFECLIFVYSDAVSDVELRKAGCRIVHGPGVWTDFMHKVPEVSKGVSSSHVAVMMDDVDTHMVHLPAFFRSMRWHRLDVASPAIPLWRWTVMRPVPGCALRRTGYVDPLFQVMTANAWSCWRGIIRRDLNPLGWGMDMVFGRHCNVSIGVLDMHHAKHPTTTPTHRSYTHRSYNATAASLQCTAYLSAMLWLPSTIATKAFQKQFTCEVLSGAAAKRRLCTLRVEDDACAAGLPAR